MSMNESSAVEAGQALASADILRTRARKLQQAPWWHTVLIGAGAVGTAFLPLPIRPWCQSAVGLALTGAVIWRLRRGTFRPRYFDNSLWLITLMFLINPCLFAVLDAVAKLGLSDRAGEALSMLTALVFTLLSFGIAFLLTRLVLWRVR